MKICRFPLSQQVSTMVDWKQIAADKQASTLANIPAKWKLDNISSANEEPNAARYIDRLLPEKALKITSMTICELANDISQGKLTALEVTDAFCQRAAYAHQIVNCCTEIFFDKAIEQAKYLDDYFKEHGKVIGPFHGIPISFKDQVNVEGVDTSIGFIGLLGKPTTKDEESTIAIKLREQGAILYVKTTVPMAMMGDTKTNAFGYTQNSVKRTMSSGGSSGGEGSLVGSRASLLGLGTDLGGKHKNSCKFSRIVWITSFTWTNPVPESDKR